MSRPLTSSLENSAYLVWQFAAVCRILGLTNIPQAQMGQFASSPLTPVQIKDYVAKAGPKLNALNIMLHEDTPLYELAETPLMLSVMSLAYQDLPAEVLTKGKPVTIEERRKNLFDTYIRRMFERKGRADPLYANNQVIEWLTWLASGMIQHSKTIFLMEEYAAKLVANP